MSGERPRSSDGSAGPSRRAWRRSSAIAVVERPGRAVTLSLDVDSAVAPLVMEGTSFDIWTLVDGTRDTAELVEELAAAYGADSDSILADVEAFLASLEQYGIVELS